MCDLVVLSSSLMGSKSVMKRFFSGFLLLGSLCFFPSIGHAVLPPLVIPVAVLSASFSSSLNWFSPKPMPKVHYLSIDLSNVSLQEAFSDDLKRTMYEKLDGLVNELCSMKRADVYVEFYWQKRTSNSEHQPAYATYMEKRSDDIFGYIEQQILSCVYNDRVSYSDIQFHPKSSIYIGPSVNPNGIQRYVSLRIVEKE